MSGRAVLRDLALKEGTGFRVIFGQIQQCQNGRKVVGAYKAVEEAKERLRRK